MVRGAGMHKKDTGRPLLYSLSNPSTERKLYLSKHRIDQDASITASIYRIEGPNPLLIIFIY